MTNHLSCVPQTKSEMEHGIPSGRRELPEGLTLDEHLDAIKEGVQQP